jgi:catechol 2,3-dioxygenase-like lactoylglutathione lyase family enzyme
MTADVSQRIGLVSVVVPDYDEAIAFYVGKMGFILAEDTRLSDAKRWVVVKPHGAGSAGLLVAKADSPEQVDVIGQQAGGRVFLFLETDDFARDHARFIAAGIQFLESPRAEAYGTVAVFRDAFGNKWDLIETCKSRVHAPSSDEWTHQERKTLRR